MDYSEVKFSKKAATIKTRYEKRYVTDAQLSRYFQLGIITEEEYIAIYQTKYPGEIPADAIIPDEA